jgi:AcrR family transcriptional regulator
METYPIVHLHHVLVRCVHYSQLTLAQCRCQEHQHGRKELASDCQDRARLSNASALQWVEVGDGKMNLIIQPKNLGSRQRQKTMILEAMLDEVLDCGLHDAPLSRVASRFGRSASVIYKYFPTKAELIHALYARVQKTKNDVLVEGVIKEMSNREAFIQVWKNCYRFSCTYPREAKFLEQYENSRLVDSVAINSQRYSHQNLLSLISSLHGGGGDAQIRDVPLEVVYSLTFGVAANLAKGGDLLEEDSLEKIADVCWRAISE